jgi:hypothetical protein
VKENFVRRVGARAARFLVVVPMLLLLTAATLRAAPVTASWNTNPEPDIAGYKLLYGTASGSYSSTIDVGNVTSYVLSLSASQTYYFVVQAYNTSGLQSAYSTEASFTVPISTAPTIVTVTPSAGAIGATVTIQGSNFGATRGTSTIAFNGVAATPTSWSATSIGVPIPVGATTGNVVVTVGGVASNGAPFAVTGAGPTITSLTPSTGWVGYAMTIVGANFGATQGTSTVTFNGTAGIPTSWSANSIVIPVPAGATTGNVVVTVNGMASNGVLCTITSATPTITTLAPSSAPAGTPVTITGTNFGATKGTSTVTFNGTAATPTSWSATSIVVPAPVGAVTGNVVVTVNGVSSNSKIFTVSGGTQTIAFVQQAYATPASGTTVAVPFGAAQTAGDLNVAIVGWNDATQTVQSVTDTKGNVYVRAVGPTVLAGSATQSIYYAKNISGAAAGANTVTVTFGGSAAYPDVRIAEYSGLDSSNPVDATAAAFGTSGASDSGAATTTNANDLMVAGNLVLQGTISAGSGYTSRVITVPDSDILEDQIVTTPGTYHATAPLTGGGWIMQLVAFKAANTSNPTSPALTSLAPTSGPVGTTVTINGANFGATRGTSTITFNGTAATPTTWSANSIVVPVPAGATSGNVTVTVNGLASNALPFTVVVAPSITNVAPSSGPVGTAVSISGANFGATKGTSTVSFNGTAATPTTWSASSIVVPVPAGATTGNVIVTVAGLASNALPFTVVVAPSITNVAPSSGPVGTAVTISGANFGAAQGASTITFNGSAATPTTWTATSIVVAVPAGATTGNVIVTVAGLASNTLPFTVVVAPSITNMTPSSGPVGTAVTISGANFGATRGTSTITFNGTAATPTTWSASSIVVPVPAGATSGNVVVTVAGLSASGGSFTVTSAGPAVITPVQHASRDAGATKSSSLPFPAKNVAGNWIGVAVRASGVGQVFTVTDTLGNIYRPAVQLTHTADTVSIAIFYAENVRGGTNTVSVSDTILGTLRFAIVEYAGVAPANSLDVIKTAQGRSTSASSGSVTTTAAGDLVLAAITTANGTGSAAGSGFVKQESLPTSGAKLMVEDRIQAGAGAVTAAASLSSTDDWGLIVAAFKAATGTGGVSMLTLAGGDSIGGAASGSQTAQAMEQTVAVATKNDNLRATDYDGDGASDLATFTPATGNWAISLSGANHSTTLNVTLGGSSDVPVPGDYDGDGRTDVAVYRPSLSKWTILTSSSGYTTSIAYVWGQAGDVPMPGDYDGDGKTDLAVYRPSTGEWLITVSATKTTMRTVLGEIGDVPVTGQFDGDHKTDIAVFTPSNGAWTVRSSSTGYTNGMALSLGAASDVLAAGDYDGDGLTDVAVYTASTGTWSVLSSKTRYATVINAAIGGNGDVAVAGDYDSDGRTDMAVYHRATGGWTIIKSSDGLPVIFNWGTSADFAVVPR